MTDLTDLEQAILAFERTWWHHGGAKEAAVRERFGMTSTRYHQLVNALIQRPEALAADPMTVKRLLRLRDTRRQHRPARAG